MPTLTRWMIKTGLAYLAIALLCGLLIAAQPVMGWSPALTVLRPVFLHLLIVGWITQLIMGVAYWMFPKQTKERPRGNPSIGWWVFALLNIGLIIRAVAEPLTALQLSQASGIALAIAAVLQVAAGWLFVINTWSRVKER